MPVLRRLMQGAQSGTQQPTTAGSQSGNRVVRLGRNERLCQIEFEKQVWPSAGKGNHAINRRPSPAVDPKPPGVASGILGGRPPATPLRSRSQREEAIQVIDGPPGFKYRLYAGEASLNLTGQQPDPNRAAPASAMLKRPVEISHASRKRVSAKQSPSVLQPNQEKKWRARMPDHRQAARH